jgi:REP element-mobilizing transposase RayT
MDKFRNKYRIPSTRLQHWDYRWAGAYFITICTHNRMHWFGEIVDGVMKLSEIGNIVQSEWLKTFELRPDMNIWMGEFVVMPNHFHAIIGIGKNEYNTQRDTQRDTQRRDAMHCVSTDKPDKPDEPQNQFGPQSKNLASIVRGFKSSVTIAARKINPGFQWQPRFYDHIIRNDESFQTISNYIINNPARWQEDKFFNADYI